MTLSLKKQVLRSVLLAVFILVLNLFSPINANAQILFSDNFNDNNISDWETLENFQWSNPSQPCLYRPGNRPAQWEVVGGRVGIKIDSPGCFFSITPQGFNLNSISAYAMEFDIEFTGTTHADRNVHLKREIVSTPRGKYGLHFLDNQILLEKGNSGFDYSNSIAGSPITYNFAANNTYRVRVEFTSDNKWNIFIDGNQVYSQTDPSPYMSDGKFALAASVGSISTSEVWFDNVVIEELPQTNFLNVPDLKQYDGAWGQQEYDTASSWSNNPTIERWGCALTSSAMALQYHGINVNPSQLNNWLNSQPDGYVRNGLLNWLAVSRYAKQHGQTDLEFLRRLASSNTLDDEIANDRPAIVKIPGHFAVVKGSDSTGYLINDPDSTKTYLAQVESDRGESYNNIYSYIPSNTNLSYIMLAINPDFDLKVFDTSGNLINGYYALEEPLLDDVDRTSESSSPLGVFMFPKPPDGTYKVEVSGNGQYFLDSYLYDQNGNVVLDNLSGFLSGNKNVYEITIGSSNSISKIITSDSLIDLLDSTFNEGHINKYIYRILRSLLVSAAKMVDRGYTRYAIRLYNKVSYYIGRYTPRYIDPVASEILKSEINLFVNSL